MTTDYRTNERKPQRHICTTCGVRLYTAHRAKKHDARTGHKSVVNWRAENAVRKYLARQNPSYLARLDQKIALERDAWT